MVACALLLFGSSVWCRAHAQGYYGTPRRSATTMIRKGILPKPDSLQLDSLGAASGPASLLSRDSAPSTLATDSLPAQAMPSASTPGELDSLFVDTLSREDLLSPLHADEEPRHRRDTIGLSGMVWISTVAPGFGQIYNKQYWKVPILYGVTGASVALFVREQKRYRPAKRELDALNLEIAALSGIEDQGERLAQQIALGRQRDEVQRRVLRVNTSRQLYMGIAALSYLYFLGDAAMNYNRPHRSNTNVKKATTLSTVIPGAGQIYNKSYWKLPFVVGGLASTIYVVDWNNRGYQRFKTAYTLVAERDAAIAASDDPEFDPPKLDEFRGAYSQDFLKDLKDSYRRSRDLSLIITAAIYVFQIVDAHVDAHLKDYDISDDLALDVRPAVNYAYIPSQRSVVPTFGFNLSLKF